MTAKDAAIMVSDKEARTRLVDEALKLLYDEHRAKKLSENISLLARPSATEDIVDVIEGIVRERLRG